MTLSPSMLRSQNRRFDVSRTLRPVRRAIGLTRVAHGALLGLAAGVLVAAAALLASRIWPLGISILAALVLMGLGGVTGIVVGLVRWPNVDEAARRADLYFGLDDRLTTALELRTFSTPIAEVQRRETERHVANLQLTKSRGRWLARREATIVGAVAILFAISLALGSNRPATHASSRALANATATRKVRHTAANEIKQLRAQLHAGLSAREQKTVPVLKLDRTLSRLRHQLMKAVSTRSALRAVSLAQQQLHRLAAGLHPINNHAVAQLNGSLSHYLGKNQSSGKSGASARSAPLAAQALSRLAHSLSHLTSSQRSALARAFARAANAMSDTSLRSAMRQVASSLANGNTHSAARTLQQASQALSRSASAQAAQSRALSAASQLGNLKTQIAAAVNQPFAPQAGRSQGKNGTGVPAGSKGNGRHGKGSQRALGKGQGKGNRNGRGGGTRAGKGTGNRGGTRIGQGTGRGRGRGAGRININGAGTGTSGAHGRGGQGRSNPTHKGKTVTVYDPGKQGQGQEIVRNGPNGAPHAGSLVPYQEVLGQYEQQAHQALDRQALPPSLQSYVHRYFSTISH